VSLDLPCLGAASFAAIRVSHSATLSAQGPGGTDHQAIACDPPPVSFRVRRGVSTIRKDSEEEG